ncbi:DNA-methyltransferase [Chloroflexota bacterium]
MKTYDDGWVEQHYGNALYILRQLPEGIAQMVCTSPPYWGLRKYDGEQEIEDWGCAFGLEPTPEMYVEHTVEFLRAIRRVLRNDGVVFWNVGDSYNGASANQSGNHGYKDGRSNRDKRFSVGGVMGLKPKDLCLIPFRVAIAAQQDNWWIRSIIIWSKPNPMPESVKDRPTESHEYIIMMTKSKNYHWDMDAVREASEGTAGDRKAFRGHGDYTTQGGSNYYYGGNRQGNQIKGNNGIAAGRNIRSVWEFPTEPYPEAHFAVFPTELPKRCIMAATSEKGNCSKCGKPWVRVVERTRMNRTELPKSDPRHRPNAYSGAYEDINGKGDAGYTDTKTIGWQPQCTCNAPTEPPIVLDPFAGSGTVGEVAKSLGRKAILIDTSKKYCKLAEKRVMAVPLPMKLDI